MTVDELIDSSKIPVKRCDLTLLWPLEFSTLQVGNNSDLGEGNAAEGLDRCVQMLLITEGGGPKWEIVKEDLQDERTFSEWAYFHSHVRNFRYRNPEEASQNVPNRNWRVLARTKAWTPSSIRFTYPSGVEVETLYCHGVELHLTDTMVGILVVRLSTSNNPTICPTQIETPWSLSRVLNAQEYVRRAYTPFWGRDANGNSTCPIAPADITLVMPGHTDGESNRVSSGPMLESTRRDNQEFSEASRQPHTLKSWQALLDPAIPAGGTRPEYQNKLKYFQILDERMQLMSYIAVATDTGINASRIHDGDWMRIVTVDTPSEAGRLTYPYNKLFCQKTFPQMTYDRFWAPEEGWETRWLCSGYAFAGVGNAEPAFFYRPDQGAFVHFHYHYLTLGMIVHMHRACLLCFERKLAEVMDQDRLTARSEEERVHRQEQFRTRVKSLTTDFRRFTATYWTLEVSNQVQGQELFDLWSNQLRTRELYRSMEKSITELNSLVQTELLLESQHKLDTNETHTIEANERLEWVELFIIAVYAIELPVGIAHLFHIDDWRYSWGSAALSIASLGTLALLLDPGHSRDCKSSHPNALAKLAWLIQGLGRRWMLVVLAIIWVTWSVLAACCWHKVTGGH